MRGFSVPDAVPALATRGRYITIQSKSVIFPLLTRTVIKNSLQIHFRSWRTYIQFSKLSPYSESETVFESFETFIFACMFSHLVWMQIQQIYTTKHEGKWIWKLKMRSCVVLLTEQNLESVILVFSITDSESCLPPSVPFFRRQVDCTFAWWWPWTGLWVVTSAPMTTTPSLRHPFVGY